MVTFNDDQLYDLYQSLKYATQYLRKMEQWKEGKIDMAVEGCDRPYMMSDEELTREKERVWAMLNHVDDLLCCDS